MGQIYKEVIDKERRFEYKGEDVEAIPHITNEITKRIQSLGQKKKADIVVIELGGTAGESQNIFYYEASRIMTLKHPQDVIHIHVSYVPTPKHLGEPKTKPTQLSVRTLNSMGIQPDFIIARSEKYLDQRRRDRFALFCNMHADDIISNPDLDNVYKIPLMLHKQGLEEKIMKKLGLLVKKPKLDDWNKLLQSIKSPKKNKITIAIVGKYFGTGEYQLRDSYAALFDAIDHAAWKNNTAVKKVWVDAQKFENDEKLIGKPDGIIVPIGWGERGTQGMIHAANYARVNRIPYLGLCYGMQLAVVAFARSVLGLPDANTAENDSKTKNPVIHMIPAQVDVVKRRAYGGTMRLGSWQARIKKDTHAWNIYRTNLISERHRHRFEFNDKYSEQFEKAGLIISARSVVENLVEIIELKKSIHPFYFATQGHPEYKSRPLNPHPVFVEFVKKSEEYRFKSK